MDIYIRKKDKWKWKNFWLLFFFFLSSLFALSVVLFLWDLFSELVEKKKKLMWWGLLSYARLNSFFFSFSFFFICLKKLGKKKMSLDYVIKKIFFMLSNINRWVFLLSLLSLIWNITTINGLLQWIDVYPMDWWFEMWKKQKKRKQEWDVWCWTFFYLFIYFLEIKSVLSLKPKQNKRERKKKKIFFLSFKIK